MSEINWDHLLEKYRKLKCGKHQHWWWLEDLCRQVSGLHIIHAFFFIYSVVTNFYKCQHVWTRLSSFSYLDRFRSGGNESWPDRSNGYDRVKCYGLNCLQIYFFPAACEKAENQAWMKEAGRLCLWRHGHDTPHDPYFHEFFHIFTNLCENKAFITFNFLSFHRNKKY